MKVFIFGIAVPVSTVKCYENLYWYGTYVIITPRGYRVD